MFSPKYLRPNENKYLDKVVNLDLFIDSIRLRKDFSPNPSIFMILSLILVIGNFVADCILALLDPRIRDMAGGAA